MSSTVRVQSVYPVGTESFISENVVFFSLGGAMSSGAPPTSLGIGIFASNVL